ncbi:MAG: UDP-N-acetylmuramoyl-L-alanyl-D-glutamate--2,6-diaminopimelate ligase [Thermoanaerobaculia bacterium]|jgi:UDP-N-acetylmuramoyl-L-alanyl-D-glutamate--2,6-diaminopimelate ligase|nr:UDP-N-acetylmuramoyl-L-alanyl-D-glutamate--2,6-diaminopimelate ligase [Thermoanaerobaculia bacterium]
MRLRDLLRDVAVRNQSGDADVDVVSVTADSRLVGDGSLFVAVPGFKTDGARFIDSAVSKGAAVIVSETSANAPVLIEVDDARAAIALIASNFHGRPADKLTLAGVTGTSGKTTTTKMIESVFDAAGGPVGLVGTIEYRAGDERLSADRTTPDAVVLQEWLAKMVDAGVRLAVMEVSSHALALKRTFGMHFSAAVFTNLSQDHFDFHKDFEDYFAAKRILFDQIDRTRKSAIVNRDDEYGRRLAEELGDCVVTFGRGADADIHPLDGFQIDVRGLHGRVHTPAGEVTIESRLLGAPNLSNWLAAIGAALAVGIDIPTIEAGIRNLGAVRGRFETVVSDRGPTVIVDYAHKPDALEKLLHAVRDLAAGRRVVVLFGCGGDRDKDKRAKMGAIAARLADHVVLTSDNPRSEKPEAILDGIESGMKGATNYERIADRREAIARAIDGAADDDVIVIAGKGHESYQVVGDQVIHFDDREEAERALQSKPTKTNHKNDTLKSTSN